TRCGSLYSAWRQALDLDDNGRVTFGEFTLALHRLGLHGDVQGLWRQLDVLNNGCIYFRDFDEETDTAVNDLRHKFLKAYGNMLLAWVKGCDVGGTGMVFETQWVEACKKVGFTGNAKKLFRLMRPEAGRGFMSLKDFDTKAYKAFARGDFRMLTEENGNLLPEEVEPKKSPLEMTINERTDASFYVQVRKAWKTSERKEFAKSCRVYLPPALQINDQEKFVALCCRKYGSLVGAWRLCLDDNCDGKLTFNEFCQSCRRLGYTGSVQELWDKFNTDGSGIISLKELDSEADDALNTFFNLVHARFEDLAPLWFECFKKDPHASLNRDDFRKGCEVLGFPDSKVEKLWSCLQPIPDGERIFFRDLEQLFALTRREWQLRNPDQQQRRLAASQLYTMALSSQPDEGAAHQGLTAKLIQQALIRDYGSTVTAWFVDLDKRGL
ncbi:unnamed protein product, partial [Polarella glacialis]